MLIDPPADLPPHAPTQPIVIEEYRFSGLWRRPAVCKLEILPRRDGRTVVIATEITQNTGTSVTNAAELLATEVCRHFGIPPKQLVWIEHYGYGRPDQLRGFDLLSFQHITPLPACFPSSRRLGVIAVRGDYPQEVCFQQPRWRPMKDQDWAELGLPPRPPVCCA